MAKRIKWTPGHAKLKNLTDYEFNPVQISERAAKELAKDLRELGQDLPYVISAPFEKDKPLPLLDGHQRKKVDIEINKVDVNKSVLILYPDRKMTDKEKKHWIVRHRKNTGSFDFDILANFYDVPDLLMDGFSEKELIGAGFEFENESQDAEPQIDRAEERTKLGDVWRLGRHVIACADSTDASILDKLLKGNNPKMVWADPPYGVDVAKSGHVGGENLLPVGNYEPVIGDETTETAITSFGIFQSVAPKAVQFWWGANYYADKLPPSPCWIVWDKRGDIASNNFADCELAWCSVNQPARLYRQVWMGMVKEGEHDRRVHPTQKPIELARWAFERYGKPADLIIDPFAGSGISIKAAEKLDDDRRVIAFELSPAYCDYIIAWWEASTGLLAVCVSDR